MHDKYAPQLGRKALGVALQMLTLLRGHRSMLAGRLAAWRFYSSTPQHWAGARWLLRKRWERFKG